MSLELATRGKNVKITFGHSREDLNHWVASLLLVHVGEIDDAGAVVEESSTSKLIDKINVTDSVDEIEQFTQDVDERETSLSFHRLDEVFGYGSAAVLVVVVSGTNDVSATAVCQIANLAILMLLPDPMRQVEEDSLQEEDKGHPLVVAVDALFSIFRFCSESWILEVVLMDGTTFLRRVGQCEGALNPAVGG